KTIGRLAEGLSAYRKAIEIKPTLGEAWWSLANLKTLEFGEADIAAMDQALAAPDLTDEDRIHLGFALGKAMHDAGRPDEAFAHYATANALRLKSQPHPPEDVTGVVHRSIVGFTAEVFAERSGGCEASDPIFVVGLPRAGSTLIEQILASHSQV